MNSKDLPAYLVQEIKDHIELTVSYIDPLSKADSEYISGFKAGATDAGNYFGLALYQAIVVLETIKQHPDQATVLSHAFIGMMKMLFPLYDERQNAQRQ